MIFGKNEKMIKIGRPILDQIKSHAEREYPHECCGLLIGLIEDAGQTRVIFETYPVANAWEEEGARDHRMMIKPEDYRRAELNYVKRGLGVVGDYHSHPESPAVPSQFDRNYLASWSPMSHIVVSVYEGRARELRSWVIEEDRSRSNEEEILKGNQSCQSTS